MPEFAYRGRDRVGKLRTGTRTATSVDNLNAELIKEGISPIGIKLIETKESYLQKISDLFKGKGLLLEELSIFSRQMQLLYEANVPVTTSLRQLATHTRSARLKFAIKEVIEDIEKGQSLAMAMQHHPKVFSPLMISIVQIGENTGRVSEAFGHLHHYLAFEADNRKRLKGAFRYPLFVGVSIVLAVMILNIFVIPTFAGFYSKMGVSLPWETRILIASSTITVHYGIYILIALIILIYCLYRYFTTPQGKYMWDRFKLSVPVFGELSRRMILIRFAQSLWITLNSGISVTQALKLVRHTIENSYITSQIKEAEEMIERGVSFTQAIIKIDLFTALEIQILAVGEKNGELGSALHHIATFHSQEIEYDLKRINDFIGPIMISVISLLILLMALGVYLPVWNMINLVHT